VHISGTPLMDRDKRLSAYAIRTQVPVVGWLHYEVREHGPYNYKRVTARLVGENGSDLIQPRHSAQLMACRGQQGALIQGTVYRARGRKDANAYEQVWWCEAPPRVKPLLDHQARILALEREWSRLNALWASECGQ
jgi:hypothetical protein